VGVITVPYSETTSDSSVVFNNFTADVTNLAYSKKRFNAALKNFPLTNSFYCLEEYFSNKFIQRCWFPNFKYYNTWLLMASNNNYLTQ
jgi:hypothetical protein